MSPHLTASAIDLSLFMSSIIRGCFTRLAICLFNSGFSKSSASPFDLAPFSDDTHFSSIMFSFYQHPSNFLSFLSNLFWSADLQWYSLGWGVNPSTPPEWMRGASLRVHPELREAPPNGWIHSLLQIKFRLGKFRWRRIDLELIVARFLLNLRKHSFEEQKDLTVSSLSL